MQLLRLSRHLQQRVGRTWLGEVDSLVLRGAGGEG